MINRSMHRREHFANHLSIIIMHRNGAHWHYYAAFMNPRGRCGYQLSNTLVLQCTGPMPLNRAMIYRLVIAGKQYIYHYRIACLLALCRVKKHIISSFFIPFYGSHAYVALDIIFRLIYSICFRFDRKSD